MLVHEFSRSASKWRLAGKHVPERRAERVEIRADVYADSRKLFRASELRRTGETSRNRNRCFGHLTLSGMQDATPVPSSKPAGIITRQAIVRYHRSPFANSYTLIGCKGIPELQRSFSNSDIRTG